MNSAIDYLFKTNPGYGWVILACIVTAISVWWISHWIHRIRKTEESCNEILPTLKRVEKDIIEVGNVSNSILVYLKTKDNNLDIDPFKSHSPISLTEAGIQVLDNSGGKIFINKHKEELFKELEKYKIQTELDVQTYAPIAISNISNQVDFNKIKDFIYNNPQAKVILPEGGAGTVAIDLPTMTNIMGIYLRDIYLIEHYFGKLPKVG